MTTMEQTFQDAWLEAIYRKDGYFKFRKIATSCQLDTDDLRQAVAIWFNYEATSLEAKCSHADVSENYLVTIINNEAAKIASRLQAQHWQDSGQFTYSKQYVRKAKWALVESQGSYVLGSDTHTTFIDFDNAIEPLTWDELNVFLTPTPTDLEKNPALARYGCYPGEPGSKEYQRFSAKVSKLTDRVWRRMNHAAWNAGRSVNE